MILGLIIFIALFVVCFVPSYEFMKDNRRYYKDKSKLLVFEAVMISIASTLCALCLICYVFLEIKLTIWFPVAAVLAITLTGITDLIRNKKLNAKEKEDKIKLPSRFEIWLSM